MIVAIDLFRALLLEHFPEEEREEAEELAKDIKDLCRVSVVRRFNPGPITEEAAQEWYRVMKENKKKP